MQLRLFAAALILALPAFAAVALADATTVEDNRNAGRSLFDIKSATAAHRGSQLAHSVDTFRAWRSRDLRSSRREPRALCVYIWKQGRGGDGKQDFEACASFREGKLRGSLYRTRPKRKRLGAFTVRRLNQRSVTYLFDDRAIGSPRVYRWQAFSGFTGPGCRKSRRYMFGCSDGAPTSKTAVHDLSVPNAPEPEPTPPAAP